MRIREIKTTADFEVAYPLVKQVAPHLTKATYRKQLALMRARGYRCIAAFDNKRMLGLSGFWEITRFWSGPYIEPDNVVVDDSARGKGVGRALMQWLEDEAERQRCNIVKLDSYATNHDSHKFYHREGYAILGFVFVKKLKTAGDVSSQIAGAPAVSLKNKRK
jgi:GNAT superfamily N-acetyltransferase